MESNRDEAIKCLSIAQQHRDNGNFAFARKFCQKSINLFATPEAQKLLESISGLESKASNGSANDEASASSSHASGSETHPSASGAKHRHTNHSSTSSAPNGTASGSGGEKRDYTPEQAAIVKRIRACKVTEYYEILSVERTCEEGDVKKAYRKARFPVFFLKILCLTSQ